MKKVLVTGGDGLLGSNAVRVLLNKGYSVKVMVQPGRKVSTLDGLDIETVEADLLDADSVLHAMEDCPYVVHIAALTNVWPTKGKLYHRINVDGTDNIIAAALTHGIARMVHVGTAASFAFGTIEAPGTEEVIRDQSPYGLAYIDTKTLGMRHVIDTAKAKGLPATVICPTFMLGAYDSKPSSGEVLINLAKGNIPAYTGGGKNWVNVMDVAHGIQLALEKGRVGEAYIMGHENLTYGEALTRLANALGVKPPAFKSPDVLVKTTGFFGEAIGRLTGKLPGLSYPLARIACDGHYFSPAKAVQELGLPQTPIEEGAIAARDWFVANGYL